MPSAPIFSYAFACATASAVVVDATPATTGTRPRAACTTTSTMRRRCSRFRYANSPVEPSGVRPCTPAAIRSSTRRVEHRLLDAAARVDRRHEIRKDAVEFVRACPASPVTAFWFPGRCRIVRWRGRARAGPGIERVRRWRRAPTVLGPGDAAVAREPHDARRFAVCRRARRRTAASQVSTALGAGAALPVQVRNLQSATAATPTTGSTACGATDCPGVSYVDAQGLLGIEGNHADARRRRRTRRPRRKAGLQGLAELRDPHRHAPRATGARSPRPTPTSR